MNKFDAMRIFIRVAELGSFTKAADSLGIPKAAASTAVLELETGYGARLLHRTTRKVLMTQDGQTYYERSKELLADLDEIESMFERRAQTLRGRLRVDMPGRLASNIVIPRLPSFLDLHPLLEVELSSTDRRVDVVREGFDCVLRVGPVGDHTLIVQTLGRMRTLNCASPAYLDRYGTPLTLEDLARHKLVYYASTWGARPSGWETAAGNGYRTIEMPGSITVNSAEAYGAACLAGLGLIQAPEMGLRQFVAEGRLVEVLADFPAEPMLVSWLYANRRIPERVRVFMNWVAETLAPSLV
jgi:DNA-binding transcriptional LysR family regulator